MDGGQSQLPVSTVHEAVRLTRRAHDHVTALDLYRLVADLEPRPPRLDDEHLGIGVSMQLRSDPGPRVDEDHAERNVAVLLPDELMRVLTVLEVLEAEDVSHPTMVIGPISPERVA